MKMVPWGGIGCCLSAAALYLLARSSGRGAEILKSVTRVNQLKELAQLLDAEILPLVVSICGRVSSETPINCEFSGLRGVIVKETAEQHFLKHNDAGSWIQDSALMPSMIKEVPWYLDDGTDRVHVVGARDAIGFVLPVGSEAFEESGRSLVRRILDHLRGLKMLGVKRIERVLPVGTSLTVVGEAAKDDVGTIRIQRPTKGHIMSLPKRLINSLQILGNGQGLTVFGAYLIAKHAIRYINKPTGDTAIAEIEAELYGLQAPNHYNLIIGNGDLEELQELGSGAFGTVYHGKWRGTDVAIKRIKSSCFTGWLSEQERLIFWGEAQILSTLHHPNVVAFYGVVPDGPGETLAIVTEYMLHGSLRNVLLKKEKVLDRRKRVMIAMDAAFGMEYLHLKNIVHFDLKCDNLLVNLGDPERPVCKVGDFGLSRIKHSTLVSGGVRGTLPWMAPELLDGNSSRVSEKVDVFSFGIAMWEILTGKEPYANMHWGTIIGGVVNNTLRPPIPKRCDSEWKRLMEECWSPDPAARPSFTEVKDKTLQLHCRKRDVIDETYILL